VIRSTVCGEGVGVGVGVGAGPPLLVLELLEEELLVDPPPLEVELELEPPPLPELLLEEEHADAEHVPAPVELFMAVAPLQQ
jgi:hypothetical protein